MLSMAVGKPRVLAQNAQAWLDVRWIAMDVTCGLSSLAPRAEKERIAAELWFFFSVQERISNG